tara:strand:- start:202 stop:801 length:600 start_codon:yes stop_codon:yes gene_type:complete
MKFNIRNYCDKDLEKVYEICLKTGDAGFDASELYQDPKLLGHVYVGPYTELEPSSAFILENDSEVCGYIIGTLNSKLFFEKVELDWLPQLRQKYKIPKKSSKYYNLDDKIIHSFHFYEKPVDYPNYPAHLHVDIIPIAQGRGLGKKMMDCFFKYLRKNNVKGLHLGVDIKNNRAIKFYKDYGLKIIKENMGSLIMGVRI